MATTELTATNNHDLAEAITEAQRQILTQKTPADVIRHRPGPGGRQLAYVEHRWVNEQLNLAFDWQWSWEIVEWRLLPNEAEPTEAFVLGRLTVHTPRGDLTKTQFGSAAVKRDKRGNVLSIGDDLKAASSDALKKAASLLGLALDLYGSEPQRQPARKAPLKPQPANGKAKANGRWTHDAATVQKLMAVAEQQLGLSQSDVMLALLVEDIREFDGTKSEAWQMMQRAAKKPTP